MPAARSFTELKFWQRARVWSADIYHIIQKPPFARDQRLVVQINDSSESVMSNMAQAHGGVHTRNDPSSRRRSNARPAEELVESGVGNL